MTNGIIERMQAEIDELKAKVERLEGAEVKQELTGFQRMAKLTKTPQKRRDEIVERAKKDYEELRKNPRMIIPRRRFEVIVNHEKRTVVVLIYSLFRYPVEVIARGIAKCAPNDCFNVHIGKAIALRRALGLEVPAEYLNAPQPTEVRVGDIVGYPFDEDDVDAEVVIRVEDDRFYYNNESFDYISALFERDEDGPEYDPRIIDDSREGVTAN